MIFQLLLWLLGRRINELAASDAVFREAIAGRVCVLQFRTHSGLVRQYYAFAGGKTDSRRALHPQPSLTFSFKSAVSALALVIRMARQPKDRSLFGQAIRDGKLRIRGDISLLPWFMMISQRFSA